MNTSKDLKKNKRCCVCGRPVFSVHSMFCQTHARVAFRMKARRFPPEAVEGVWDYLRANGDRCFYTKLPLEMEDIRSPWFCVFDHLIPLDPRRIVVTCALVNEMKTALSVREFWYYVQQLADFIDKGKKIKKIKLAYWRQNIEVLKGTLLKGTVPLRSRGQSPSAVSLKSEGLFSLVRGQSPSAASVKGKKCDLCGRPVFNIRSKYCRGCSHFAHRLEMQRFDKKVIQEILDYVRRWGFRCFYTGMLLDISDFRSPWYVVFDCLTPGDRSRIVLTSALFNEMKSDLSIKEFWYYIRQLANYKRKHTKIRKKKLVYWFRLTLKELHLKSLRD